MTDENITPGDLVIVKWRDTEDDCRWEPIALIEHLHPPLVKTVGWLLSQDDSCVRLLYSIAGDDAGRSIIPKACVESIEKVRDDELDVDV